MANVGSLDRVLRLAAGTVLLVAPLALPDAFAALGGWRFALAAAGGALIGTGIARFCPAYLPLGISTCRRDGG